MAAYCRRPVSENGDLATATSRPTAFRRTLDATVVAVKKPLHRHKVKGDDEVQASSVQEAEFLSEEWQWLPGNASMFLLQRRIRGDSMLRAEQNAWCLLQARSPT